jgi:hypothetical protein
MQPRSELVRRFDQPKRARPVGARFRARAALTR